MKKDGREIARTYEQRVLKALHKFGWLRTRDLAALIWMRGGKPKPTGFVPEPIVVEPSAWRMAQRTLARLRKSSKVLWIQAPDGSIIYGLAEAGARQLVGLGIPASSGKDLVRRISLSHFHHRRLANEIAILASLQGYRVASEREIATGQWLGGKDGIAGKVPDVIVRQGQAIWWIEVERSRRNQRDEAAIRAFLMNIWAGVGQVADKLALPAGHKLKQVLFICENAFIDRLHADLRAAGWSDETWNQRIAACRLLYVTEAKFLLKPESRCPGETRRGAAKLPVAITGVGLGRGSSQGSL